MEKQVEEPQVPPSLTAGRFCRGNRELESEFLIDPCKFLERCLFHGELVALRGERGEDGLV